MCISPVLSVHSDSLPPVGAVFSSVASSYDQMNDLMSLGIHRLWKDHFVRSLNPGSPDPGKPWHILDVAGGTGDIAFRMLDHARDIHGDTRTKVTIADINPDMLSEGRKRAATETNYYHPQPLSQSSSTSPPTSSTTTTTPPNRLDFMLANAESMSSIPSNSIDLYTVAFGIRNFTHKDVALREALRVLKPGGVFACLEFSKLTNPVLDAAYKRWSFGAIPLIGQLVAGDRDSYQYLVESIERFPSQSQWAGMIRDAGFVLPNDAADQDLGREPWENLTGGIAAIHKGIKPLAA